VLPPALVNLPLQARISGTEREHSDPIVGCGKAPAVSIDSIQPAFDLRKFKGFKGRLGLCATLLYSTLILLLCSIATLAQTQASCTFTFLPNKFTIPDLGTMVWNPQGINDFGTVVGTAPRFPPVGIIRWPRGGVTALPKTNLTARNNKGISMGFAEDRIVGRGTIRKPILLNGTTISDITLNGLRRYAFIDRVTSINKWGTIVGTYSEFSAGDTSFKRWPHGGFISLDFPGSGLTVPLSINDDGTVVGYYVLGNGSRFHGFIYDKGQWATLDLPKVSSTALVGITNTGVIIGTGYKLDFSPLPFLYENGTFKVISVPNSIPGTTGLTSISPKRGLILGGARFSPGRMAFIATCQ
jgi:hypothetical protein